MVAITARDRPKTDYERWLELQGSDDAAGSDEKQYHPPAPLPVPEHGQGAHAKADDDKHKYTPHGTFIHHGYHHERPGASADNNIIANNHPHALLPHHLDSSFSGNYGGVAMKLALLVFVVLGLLRAVRFVRGRRYQPIRLQSPSTVQVASLTPYILTTVNVQDFDPNQESTL
ncbi:hypothetical protein AnigIFM63604_004165 [Aspergillus niger]|uniref:Contig An02c0240, genomic contig n=2 Tax=Aspergillus niger TaxID=5061 RepID=A2QDQ4_ASPNC|nr:uncharacterized protein An02g07920 [Aspergillus niger]GJP91486.1 PHD-finger family protein [Aspergillus niger]GKZ92835.1 hypothetical protein AnigIFM59636_005896 [Aspergillus niger]GLA48627.1 hypothetical protein AnigIFM63604_004165 [Aspergillus niger]CAK37755.1 unnamed protein product [Aspergillus niger]